MMYQDNKLCLGVCYVATMSILEDDLGNAHNVTSYRITCCRITVYRVTYCG